MFFQLNVYYLEMWFIEQLKNNLATADSSNSDLYTNIFM